MITVDGVEMRTAIQWAKKRRAVLKRQEKKGLRRSWSIPGGDVASATFYREDQTRPFNKKELQRAQRQRRRLEKTRKARLSCKCCGQYFGRDAVYELENGLCDFCRKPHTAWQWLAHKRCAPKTGEEPTGIRPRYWNPDERVWAESDKVWYYYTDKQVSKISDKRFERLKALYIKAYGGWETIDLEHTEYDGHMWW